MVQLLLVRYPLLTLVILGTLVALIIHWLGGGESEQVLSAARKPIPDWHNDLREPQWSDDTIVYPFGHDGPAKRWGDIKHDPDQRIRFYDSTP